MGLLRAAGLVAAAAATVAVGANDEVQKKDQWVSPFEDIYTEALCAVRFPYSDKSNHNTQMRIGCIENIPYNFLALYEEDDFDATLQCRDAHTAAADIELCKKIKLGKSYGMADRQRKEIQRANRKVLEKKESQSDIFRPWRPRPLRGRVQIPCRSPSAWRGLLLDLCVRSVVGVLSVLWSRARRWPRLVPQYHPD